MTLDQFGYTVTVNGSSAQGVYTVRLQITYEGFQSAAQTFTVSLAKISGYSAGPTTASWVDIEGYTVPGDAQVAGGPFANVASNPGSGVVGGYRLNKYAVSKGFYDAVRGWATNSAYAFARKGNYASLSSTLYGGMQVAINYRSRENLCIEFYSHAGPDLLSGTDSDRPVMNSAPSNALLWCNAYSEMAGLEPVYYTDSGCTTLLSSSTATQVYRKDTANGFRLPTEKEWEFAARGGKPALTKNDSYAYWKAKYVGGYNGTDERTINTYTFSNRITYSYNYSPTDDMWRQDTDSSDIFAKTTNVNPTSFSIGHGVTVDIQPDSLGLYNIAGNVVEFNQVDAASGNPLSTVTRGAYFYTLNLVRQLSTPTFIVDSTIEINGIAARNTVSLDSQVLQSGFRLARN
jgi:hypothetical protein